ncbi:MAG TPA: hypothetical protein PLC99_00630 [Verrucomicrobiota bacterium]|nr:hypothetical protein [Verrucomicrobiota bacterium]
MKTQSAKCGCFFFTLCVLLAYSTLSSFAATGRFLNLPSGWGQQPDPVAEAREAQRQAQRQAILSRRAELEQKAKRIGAIVQSAGADAYRKYSDGTVAFLGVVLYRHEGLNTNTGSAYAYLDRIAVLDEGFRVEDAAGNGCRISPLRRSGNDNDIFVVGLSGYSGRIYHDVLTVRRVGDYKYTTVRDSSRTIPRFELAACRT